MGDYHEPDDIPGFTNVQVSDTGGYRYDPDTKQTHYDAPIFGDVPWNQREGDDDMPEVDLGWTDISTLVVEAMEMDTYIKEDRNEPVKNVNGEVIYNGDGTPWTRGSFGARAPVVELTETGEINRLAVEA